MKNYYKISNGHLKGVTNCPWDTTQNLVIGFPDSRYKGFKEFAQIVAELPKGRTKTVYVVYNEANFIMTPDYDLYFYRTLIKNYKIKEFNNYEDALCFLNKIDPMTRLRLRMDW